MPTRVRRAVKPPPPPFSPPPPKEKKQHLRWYQYSLRTMLLLMLFVSLFMSWFATKLQQAKAQKKAVAEILGADGTVEYDYQRDAQGQMIKGAKGRGPAWLRKLLGPDCFDTVAHVSVGSVKTLEALGRLPRLRSLDVAVRADEVDALRGCEMQTGWRSWNSTAG